MGTYCMRYGLIAKGFRLDHSRPLQPIISSTPATQIVGYIHHRRVYAAWTTWMAIFRVRGCVATRRTHAPVESENKTTKRMQIHSVGTYPYKSCSESAWAWRAMACVQQNAVQHMGCMRT